MTNTVTWSSLLFYFFATLQFSVLRASSLFSRQNGSSDLTIQTFDVSNLCHIEGTSSKPITLPTAYVSEPLMDDEQVYW